MPAPFPIDDPSAACGPTLAAVQAVLDGDYPAVAFDTDPHAAACPACRARVGEVRALLAALAVLPEPVTVPDGFAAGVLSAVRADRRARRRRRRQLLASAGGGLAAAAAVLAAVWILNRPTDTPQVVEKAPAVVLPAPAPGADPAPRPVRMSDELAKAGDALRESSLPLSEPVAAAPKVLATLAGAMIPPVPAPMADEVAPAAESLAELPSAARTGLEPVTGTTQKAFARLLRDVGVFQTAARPKS